MNKICRTCLFEINNDNFFKLSDKIECGDEIIDILQMIFKCAGLEVGLDLCETK